MQEEQKQPNLPPPQGQPQKPVYVTVVGLLTDDATSNPVVVLQSKENERVLLMWVGDAEALAIDFALQKSVTERPLTHKLTLNVIHAMGGTLTHVVIDRLRKGTYYASLFVRTKDNVSIIDARPSDAIALAIALGCPLMVERTLFEKASTRLHIDQKNEKVTPTNLEINIQFISAPPPTPIDSKDEAKSVAQLAGLMQRTPQPLEQHELTKEDIARIQRQLATARSLEEQTEES